MAKRKTKVQRQAALTTGDSTQSESTTTPVEAVADRQEAAPTEAQAPAVEEAPIAEAPPQQPVAEARTAGAVRPWFPEDRGLGIAGTARKPGAPGTRVATGPEVRVVRLERGAVAATRPAPPAPGAEKPAGGWPARLGNNAAAQRPVATGQRTVRHVGTATRGGLEAGTASTPLAVAPALPQREEQRPAAAQPGRPVVHVSISQAAAAGGQTIRPFAPTVPTHVATVARQSAPAAAPEKKRREVAPAVPLSIPDADATFLAVQGLGTPSCIRRVEKAVAAVPGVTSVEANLAAGLVAISPAGADRTAVQSALAGAGHPAREGAPDAATSLRQARRLGLAAGATLGLGIVAWGAGRTAGSDLLASAIAVGAFATAWPVVQAALRHLVRGRPAAEILPVAAALATLVAAQLAPGPSPALATLPLAVHLTIAALARLAGARALQVIEALRAALPGGEARPGALLEIAAGGVVPADGRLLAPAILDERPVGGDDDVERLAGEVVSAGAVAPQGAAIEVTTATARSRMARGLRIAERALATRPSGTPAQVAATLLVPAALAAAGAAAVLAGPWTAAALLAAAAPLSLGVVASLASAAGVTRAAARGVAVRSSAALERAAATRVVLLDKTATLTRGDAAVLELLVKPGRDARVVLAAATAAEAGVDHGIARALASHARDLQVEVPAATGRRHEAGLGVQAQVAGQRVTVGSAHFAASCGVDLGLLVQTVDDLARRGRTPLVVAFEEEAVAVLGIAETPRESARQAMGSLELLDLDLRVASGDATPSVQWLAEAIGLDKRVARGDLSPAQKKALVDELRGYGPCLVAGASAVDADALAAADLAVAAGTDPAAEAAAGALLLRQDPHGVVELIRAGRASRRGRNVGTVAGLFGNGLAIALAATGGVGVGGAAALALTGSLVALAAAASPWVRVR